MIRITNKKRFILFCLTLAAILAGIGFLIFRFLTAPETVGFEKLSGKQKTEMQSSVFNKNLELFKFEDDKNKTGKITLTTFDEKDNGSKESQFVFSEKYQDGYKFTQDGTEIDIVPRNISGQNFGRKVSSVVQFSNETQKNSGQFVAYENNQGEKHLFALSRSNNTLKQWSLYEKYAPQISESWELKGAVLKQMDDGSIQVYKLPVNKDSQDTMKNLEPDMAQRISNTLKAEMGDDYYFQKNNFLFTIPKPFFVGKNGEKKDAQVSIENQNVLNIQINTAKEDFPLLLDPTITLASKMNYIQINGDASGDGLGTVSSAGDVNGDGKDDVIVGASGNNSNTGAVYIFYGGVTSGTASDKANVKLTGDAAGDYFGDSVASAGDVNGDGKDDVIVGASNASSYYGAAYIFYGGVTSGVASAKANVKLTGDAESDYFDTVASAGDVNGDGKDDVIVGASNASSGYGVAYIFYGGVTSGVASAQANVKLTGDAFGNYFGSSVSSAGDVNGDGKDDVIVGASSADGRSGSAYIFYGGVTSGTASDKANVKLTGDAANNYFGWSVSSAGDMNGDGKDDVIVGAPSASSYYGAAYIFYGGVTSGVASAKANVKLTGDAENSSFGAFVSSAGDVNGDGKSDVIVGAPYFDDDGINAGNAYIFYGGVTSGVATAQAGIKLTGDSADDHFGYHVSSAGDVNGDGRDEVIVGAYGDDDGGAGSGSAKIYTFNNFQNSAKFTGDAANDQFGVSVASAGDVNGDGLDDVIVGANGDDDGGSASGSAFIFYGGTSSGKATGKANIKLTGETAGDKFGSSVASAGDVNNDGLDDVIVGASYASSNGAAYIFYGGVVTSGTAAARSNVKLTGDASGDKFGASVASAGDVNGDGKDDVIVGAWQNSDGGGSFSGSAYIFYGGVTSGVATAQANVKLTGDASNNSFGTSVASAGDVNGDGKDDVIVGAQNAGTGGSAYIFYGGVTSGGATAQANVKLTGDASGDAFGMAVSSAGDVNGDGLDDVLVAASGDDDGYADSGSVFIFYGGVTSGGADAKANVKLTGDVASDRFGQSVASAGDVNGDGKDDIIVGTSNHGSGQGAAYIFYSGVTSGVASVKADVKLDGDAASDYFYSVASAGDVNGDGKDDVIVGAYGDDDNGSKSGSAFIFSIGPSGEILQYESSSNGNDFGISVSSAGDVNGDGLDDVIVGAPYDDVGASNTGSALIFYGGGLDGMADDKANVKLTGDEINDYFGCSVSSAGDVNGDGLDDVIVGAYFAHSPGTGAAYIFYGGVASGVASNKASVILTGDSAGDYFGSSVSSAGDMNDDGKGDVIVGAKYDDDGGEDSGSAFIFYGGVTSGSATDKANVKLTGSWSEPDNGWFGNSVAFAGDMNGDGLDDVMVTAGCDTSGYSSSSISPGLVYIFYGGVTSGTASAQVSVKLTDTTGERFGFSVSSAGDMNGDGKDDIIVGAPSNRDNGSGSGAVFVFYGGVTSGEASTQASVEITGDGSVEGIGVSVSSAGDVNGDGKGDVAVAGSRNPFGVQATYIFYGGVTSGTASDKVNAELEDSFFDARTVAYAGDINGDGKGDIIVGGEYYNITGGGDGVRVYTDLATKNNPDSPNFQITGNASGNYFGNAVASAGDVNGDGLDDIIVGTPSDNTNGTSSGAAYIFYGGVTSGTANAKADVKLTGDSIFESFGNSVASAGDVNGDGLGDVIVGSYQDDDGGNDSGSAYIFYGGITSGTATSKAAVKITGDAASDSFGTSVASAGDVNGDGLNDVIVGASGNTGGKGAAYIFYGGVASGVASTQAAVKLTGDTASDWFGGHVASAGDMNSDGRSDVIVGAVGADDGGSGSGSAFIFYGGVTSGAATAKANVKLTGDAASDSFGYDVDSAGDMNGDGKSDVIVGAINNSSNGAVYIFYGGVASGTATAQSNVKLTGDSASDLFGSSVASAGDVNKDGLGDVIVGAIQDDDGGANSGTAFVFYGGVTSGAASTQTEFKMTGAAAGDWFGYSVASAGDINGDGLSDFIVGASDNSSNTGAAYIYYGHRISPEMPSFIYPTVGTYVLGQQNVYIFCGVSSPFGIGGGGGMPYYMNKYGQLSYPPEVEAFYGSVWNRLTLTDDGGGNYYWDLASVPSQTGIKFRCRNNIYETLGGFSRWYDPLQTGISVGDVGVKFEGNIKTEGGMKIE